MRFSSPQDFLGYVHNQTVALSDPNNTFVGITHQWLTDTVFPNNWFIKTPRNNYGLAAAQVPFFNMNGTGSQGDFGLPLCNTAADCVAFSPTGAYATCAPLASTLSNQTLCLGHSDAVLDQYFSVITSAPDNSTVDITTLFPFPDGRFLAMLRNAINTLSAQGKNVTLRILGGNQSISQADAATADTDYLKQVTRDLAADSSVTVVVGTTRSCFDILNGCGNKGEPFDDVVSINHAKITVAGNRVIVGGHNQYTGSYLEQNPVEDVDLEVQGNDVARYMQGYANEAWGRVCQGNPNWLEGQVFDSKMWNKGIISDGCIASANFVPSEISSNSNDYVAVMASGRLGAGITQGGNQDNVARTIAYSQAQEVWLMQQDTAGVPVLGQTSWPVANAAGDPLNELAAMLLRGGQLNIIQSNLNAVAYDGESYSNGVPIEATADEIKKRVMALNAESTSPLSETEINNLLCKNFFLAPFRFGPSDNWQDGSAFGLHVKLWMAVDATGNKIFYIGSDNFYNANLQEQGLIVGDANLADQMLGNLILPAMNYSASAAISGAAAPSCYYLNQTAALEVKPRAPAPRASSLTGALAQSLFAAAQLVAPLPVNDAIPRLGV